MFLDARQVPQDTILESDICIVGAGAGGIAIARELIGDSRSVIVLESGGYELDWTTQALYEGENVGLSYSALQTGRSRYFGGSSNCWGGWCRPLDEIDFQVRDWVPYSGWPISRADLEPYYARACEVCDVGTQDYDPDDWEPRVAEDGHSFLHFQGNRVETQVSQVSREPKLGHAYKEQIQAASNVSVYLHANAVELEASDNAAEVTGVRIATLDGNKFRVSSKLFVLATGGIENARLMLASNRVQSAGLGNQNDLVGRYFMEHPRLDTGEFVLNDPAATVDLYDVQYTYFHAPIGASLGLTAETQREEKLLNYKTWILSVYYGEDSRGGEALKNLYRAIRKTTMPDHFMETNAGFWGRNIGNVMLDFPSTAAVILGRLSKSKRLVKKRVLANLCEAVPDPESRVMLSDQKDALGQHRVRLDWRLNPMEKYTIRRAQEIIGEELEQSGIGRVESHLRAEDDNHWPEDLEWGWHHMGTTRMHDDPKQGVVDRDCKVHGLANLYVAGSSVFPTGGSDLPTMTVVALALRLADRLKDALALTPEVSDVEQALRAHGAGSADAETAVPSP